MRHKLVLWFLPLLIGFLIGFILQYSRLQRVQQELSALDKTIRILSVQPTIVAASRHSHDDVSGGGAKKLREGRGVFQGGF
jgi:hypothetical protein